MKYLLIAFLFLMACSNEKQEIGEQIRELREEMKRENTRRDEIGMEMEKESCSMVGAIMAKKKYDEAKFDSLDAELQQLNASIFHKLYLIDSLESTLENY